MDIFAEERVHKSLQQEFAYIFATDRYPGIPEVTPHLITEAPFEVHDLLFVPIRLMHLRLPILGYRIGDFSYLTDANFISAQEKQKLIGSRILVVNGLRKEPHISHFSLSESVELIREINPERGYITHISHQMGLSREVEKMLPEHIYLAYDGLTLELNS
jgi:phosphoribosyl 1,2-cyclic phosphate phosphodiesterase